MKTALDIVVALSLAAAVLTLTLLHRSRRADVAVVIPVEALVPVEALAAECAVK